MEKLTVTARNHGHYGEKHRRPGETFDLAARVDFAASWMEPKGWDPKAPPAAEPPAAPPPPPAEKPAKTKATATET